MKKIAIINTFCNTEDFKKYNFLKIDPNDV